MATTSLGGRCCAYRSMADGIDPWRGQSVADGADTGREESADDPVCGEEGSAPALSRGAVPQGRTEHGGSRRGQRGD